MQLMWVSGPTASVRTISITAKKVLVAVCASAFVLVAFGVLLHFVGFRIAIEMSPSLARSMGGVTTEAEQQKVEAVYRERLDNLRQTMSSTVQEIRQLENLKLQNLNVLVGANGAGKSNFISFFRMLSRLITRWLPPPICVTNTAKKTKPGVALGCHLAFKAALPMT